MKEREQFKEKVYRSSVKLDSYKKKVENSEDILTINKKHILNFYEHGRARGLSDNRLIIYLQKMVTLGRLTEKDFKQMDKKDMEKLVGQIEANKKYSDWTKNILKQNLKGFYHWLYELDKGEPLPKVVRWVEVHAPPSKINPEDLLTFEDVAGLIRATPNPMYKALISCLYEGALRPGELLSLRIKDCIFNEHKVTIKVYGKKGKKEGEKTLPLYNSYDLLKDWLDQHPFKTKNTSPLWLARILKDKEPVALKIDSLGQLVQRIYDLSDTKKKRGKRTEAGIWPYLFRHSRAVWLVEHLGETYTKEFLGHVQDSRMLRTYLHLSQQRLMNKMDSLYGLKKEEVEGDESINVCPACKHPAPFGNEICNRCGSKLTAKTYLEVENEIVVKEDILKLLQSPGVLNRMKELAGKEV